MIAVRQALIMLVGVAGAAGAPWAVAEEVTLTTYYPSPRGVYEELRTTNNAYLATLGGNVGIGTTNPGTKLEVVDNTQDFQIVAVSDREGPFNLNYA